MNEPGAFCNIIYQSRQLHRLEKRRPVVFLGNVPHRPLQSSNDPYLQVFIFIANKKNEELSFLASVFPFLSREKKMNTPSCNSISKEAGRLSRISLPFARSYECIL